MLRFENVKVTGATATADARFPGGEDPDQLRFEQAGDDWRISDPSSGPSG